MESGSGSATSVKSIRKGQERKKVKSFDFGRMEYYLSPSLPKEGHETCATSVNILTWVG